MSVNQKTRLLVAAKDAVKALSKADVEQEDLYAILVALRFELTAALPNPNSPQLIAGNRPFNSALEGATRHYGEDDVPDGQTTSLFG